MKTRIIRFGWFKWKTDKKEDINVSFYGCDSVRFEIPYSVSIKFRYAVDTICILTKSENIFQKVPCEKYIYMHIELKIYD